MTDTSAFAVTVTDPTEETADKPVTGAFAFAVTVTDPTEETADKPVTGAFAFAVTVTEVTADVAPGRAASPSQAPSPHPPEEEFQPLKKTVASDIYAIRIIAVLASAVGKTMVKAPDVDVLSLPKSNTMTDGLVNAIEVVFGVVL